MKRAALILIVKDGKILATHRKNNPNDFGLIGGSCNEGEAFEDAALRELFEETGLRAYDLKFAFQDVDGDFVVRTFIPKKFFGKIKSEEDLKTKGEAIPKWVDRETLFNGSFGEYNKKLFATIETK